MKILNIITSLILFVFILYVYFLIKNEIYIRSLHFIKPNKSLIKTSGPFITSNGIQIFNYNPSIYKLNNGSVITVSRLSGHSNLFRQNKCMKSIKTKFIYDEEIDKNIKLFPINKQRTASLLMIEDSSNHRFVVSLPEYVDYKSKYIGMEDPRIFEFNNELWIYFHDNGNVMKNKRKNNIVIAKLKDPSNSIYLFTDKMSNMEKNWMPFVYNNELYIEYSLCPHVILKPDLQTGYSPIVYTSYTKFSEKRTLGGGSPSVKIYVKGIGYYLGFGHTRGKYGIVCVRKNFFYIFQNKPPFNIIWFGPELNMEQNHKNIEFGTGLLVKDNIVYVSYGIDDCYGKINEYKLEDVIKDFLDTL